MSSTTADFFLKDQFHGPEGEEFEPLVNNCYPNQDSTPINTRVTASITPESYQSYHNMSQEKQSMETGMMASKEGVLHESPFDFSDYDESITFGVPPMPQQQAGKQQDLQREPIREGVSEDRECVVKSEYSPVFPVSVSSSASQTSSSVTKADFVDFLNDGYDELVQDDFGPGVGSAGMHETGGKVSKKRKEKTSHNVIEKKYRTNINDKIFQLREIVPTLRFAYKRYSGMPILAQDAQDLDGLEPARKLNKASILMKTIEYIQHLESKCSVYQQENQQLKNNIPRQDSLRQQTITEAAAPTSIPGGHRAANQSNSIPTQIAGQFQPYYDSPTYSTAPSSSSRQQSTIPSDNNSYNSDYASKFLMGGMALTMGASCFGENGGDMGAARALFAMPVFRFSPQNGFVISNAHGVVDLQSSFFSLLRLSLVLISGVYLLNSLLFSPSKGSGKKNDAYTNSIFPTRDTVQFDTVDHLKQTLRKTLVINRLKYQLNSMERIESKIAKCFAIKLYFQESSLPWSFFAEKYVSKVWEELKSQVNAANVKSNGLLRMGLEWDMITNIITTGREMTLDNVRFLNLLSKGQKEYDLKEFVSLLNSHILKDKTEDMLATLLEKLISIDFNDWSRAISDFGSNELDRSDLLRSIPEKCTVLDCLIRADRESCDKLSKWIMVNKEADSETLLNEKLVLYGSIVRRLIELRQFTDCDRLLSKLPLRLLETSRDSISMVGFTSIYLMLNSIFESMPNIVRNSMTLETVCGELRIWLGTSPGDSFNFRLRSSLIAYCIDKSLLCDSLTQFDEEDLETLDDGETDDDDTDKDDEMTDFDE